MPNAPLVTLFVMAYKQAPFIEETIRGAFAQTYEPLEIILSDDNSPDDTYAIMERMAAAYDGPHKVRLNRNPQNKGFIGHLNQIFDLSRGELIVYNPGDDISEPERVAKLAQAAFDSNALLVHSDAQRLTEDGVLTADLVTQRPVLEGLTLTDMASSLSLCIGATCAWHPDLMRLFGPVTQQGTYDDLVFHFRAALLDRVAFVPEPLLRYRTGVGLSERPGPDRFALSQKDARRKAYARKLTLRADTYRQRVLDAERVHRPDAVAKIRPELAELEATLALLDDPRADWPARFRSLSAFRQSLRQRRRIRRKLTEVTEHTPRD